MKFRKSAKRDRENPQALPYRDRKSFTPKIAENCSQRTQRKNNDFLCDLIANFSAIFAV